MLRTKGDAMTKLFFCEAVNIQPWFFCLSLPQVSNDSSQSR